jgi:hypothetical protein
MRQESQRAHGRLAAVENLWMIRAFPVDDATEEFFSPQNNRCTDVIFSSPGCAQTFVRRFA